jgi:hypothetical protein
MELLKGVGRMEYYKAIIVETAREIKDVDYDFENFNEITLTAKTLDELKTHILDRYGLSDVNSFEPMYQDKADGTANICGYIYEFENRDISHNSEPWQQVDWINIYKINRETVLFENNA